MILVRITADRPALTVIEDWEFEDGDQVAELSSDQAKTLAADLLDAAMWEDEDDG